MSNKIVPHIYRLIIDDVIANVGVDFEEYGMDEEVLTNLQAKWEAKLLETRVADFARAPNSTASDSPDRPGTDGGHSTTASSSHREQSHPQYPNSSHVGGSSGAQYGYSNPQGYYGQSYPNGQYGNGVGGSGAPAMGLALPGMNLGMSSNGHYGDVRVKDEPEEFRPRGGAPDDFKPDVKPEPNAAGLLPGDEVIDSDLDDSEGDLDEDPDAEEDGEVDIVFCVYDKVQRVKNKWKTVFKDGMIHINGRDYLFAKCNGEFEW